MDELAPSLRLSARGGAYEGDGSNGREGESSVSGETVVKRETVVGRCTAAALGTGVDCVLDEEFSASREPARVSGFPQVRRYHSCY